MDAHPSLLVGCGSRAQMHARALTDSERFDLVAVCDLDRGRAEETADEFGVPSIYTDADTALEAESPTHVSVVTPPTTRLPLLTDVLEHEPPSLLSEKPLANTLADVLRIERAANEVDTRVTVCHQKIWGDELRALKGWLDDGRLGEVTRLVGSTKLGTAQQGTHFVHAMNWLLDARPDRVHGWAGGPGPLEDGPGGHEEPADALYELGYPGGPRAFVHQGWDAPDVPEQEGLPHLEYRLDVLGTEGRAAYVLGHHAEGVFADGTERVDARPFDEDAYMTRGLYDRLGAVLSGEADDHPADLASAVAAHRTLDAALRSAIEGRAVDPRENPPALGRSTNERLRRRLAARAPVTVSSLLYGDRSREAVLDSLAGLGVHHVDLWGTGMFVDHHFDPAVESVADVAAALDDRAMSVPVVSIFDDEPVAEKIRFAGALGAEIAVMGGRTPERPDTWDADEVDAWLAVAAEAGVTLAFENHVDTLETVDEMAALLDALDHPNAGICLAPPHLEVVGGHATDALARLGDSIEVVYLWDMEPGVTRETADDVWYGRGDSQVPGGGGAVDFERYLAAAVEHAPEARWVLCYHGTEDWPLARIEASIARSLRFVEARRP